MRIGISTAAFYSKAYIEEAIERIKVLEADCIEAFLDCRWEQSAQRGRQLKAIAGATPITSVHPLSTRDEPGLFMKSARQREEALQVFSGALEAGKAMGVGCYVMHGQIYPQGIPQKPVNYDFVARCIEPTVEMADRIGIKIAWENTFYASFRVPEFAYRMRQHFPQLCFTLDIKQAYRAQIPWQEYMQAMGKSLTNVHVSDWKASGQFCLPGQGIFDFDALAKELHKIGYDGAIILEPYSEAYNQDIELGAALSFLRQKFQNQGEEVNT